MTAPMPIYVAWPQENFAAAVAKDFESMLRLDPEASESLVLGQRPAQWSNWAMHWYKEYGSQVPDVSNINLTFACSEEAEGRLWPHEAMSQFRLPLTVDGQPWVLVLPQSSVDRIDGNSSHIEWMEAGGQRWVSQIPWVNIVDPRVAELDLFKLSLQPRAYTYLTDRFVQRVQSLGLKGLEFRHVGYIVDSPEHAIPEPPRPAPEAAQALRWPRWREPAAEQVQASQAAAAAWLEGRGLDARSPAADILFALTQAIEGPRTQGAPLKSKALKTLLAGAGGAWGLLLNRDCHWRWVELPVSSRRWQLGLETPDGSHALCLDQVIERQLASDQPCTLTLMFNMIAAGQLPPGQAGDRVVMG